MYECLKNYQARTALDAFGGTATVSMLFAQMGMKVTYCDGLNSNRICARALTGEPGQVLSESEFLDILKDVVPRSGFVSSNFNGMYYTSEENEWIDGFLETISALSGPEITDTLEYCFYQACLQKRPFNMFHRANLNLRSRDVSRTFGNHSTWERPFCDLMVLALSGVDKARNAAADRVVVSELASPSQVVAGFDLVYIDPPYLNSKRVVDSYVDRYHLIEGMSLRGRWQNMINFDSPTKKFHKGYFDEGWEDKGSFPELLEGLVDKHRNSVVALSYAEGRNPAIKDIQRMFSKKFRRVRTEKYRTSHALSAASTEEIMIIGEPR